MEAPHVEAVRRGISEGQPHRVFEDIRRGAGLDVGAHAKLGERLRQSLNGQILHRLDHCSRVVRVRSIRIVLHADALDDVAVSGRDAGVANRFNVIHVPASILVGAEHAVFVDIDFGDPARVRHRLLRFAVDVGDASGAVRVPIIAGRPLAAQSRVIALVVHVEFRVSPRLIFEASRAVADVVADPLTDFLPQLGRGRGVSLGRAIEQSVLRVVQHPAGLLAVVVVVAPDEIVHAGGHAMGLGIIEHRVDASHAGDIPRRLIAGPFAGVPRHDRIEVLQQPLLEGILLRGAAAAQIAVDVVERGAIDAVPKLNACRLRLTSTGVPGATPSSAIDTSPLRKLLM